MGMDSLISWTNHSFAPWIGCQRVSPGCQECYAEDMAAGLLKGLTGPLAGPKGQTWGPQGPRVIKAESGWQEPLAWNRKAQKAGIPAFVFCAHLADVFEDVTGHRDEAAVNAARLRLWALIAETPWLVWLLLTKRPQNVAAMVPPKWMPGAWPSNVWIGCTVEDQQRAEERLPHLLTLPATVRFVSYEPALGPVDWRCIPENFPGAVGDYLDALSGREYASGDAPEDGDGKAGLFNAINWLIVGGESGRKARPFQVEWARDTIRQCREAGVPVWVKQMGAQPRMTEREAESWAIWRRQPDGLQPVTIHPASADPAEWPEHLRVQERPAPAIPMVTRP